MDAPAALCIVTQYDHCTWQRSGKQEMLASGMSAWLLFSVCLSGGRLREEIMDCCLSWARMGQGPTIFQSVAPAKSDRHSKVRKPA